MEGPSSTVIESTTQNQVKYLGPPLNLTRWQRFWNYMKTPEAGLWPMGLMVVGAHVFVGYYLFSEEFLDDFEDDVEAPTVVKKMVSVNKKWKDIRENFTAS